MADYKVVKVTYTRGVAGLIYPNRYNAQEVDANGTGPAAVGIYSGELRQGMDSGHCLIILKSDLADIYAAEVGMEIVSPSVADALLEKWRKSQNLPSEVVSDPDRLNLIQLKKQLGITLSQEDLDALDPDKKVPGVSRYNTPLRERFPDMNILDA